MHDWIRTLLTWIHQHEKIHFQRECKSSRQECNFRIYYFRQECRGLTICLKHFPILVNVLGARSSKDKEEADFKKQGSWRNQESKDNENLIYRLLPSSIHAVCRFLLHTLYYKHTLRVYTVLQLYTPSQLAQECQLMWLLLTRNSIVFLQVWHSNKIFVFNMKFWH